MTTYFIAIIAGYYFAGPAVAIMIAVFAMAALYNKNVDLHNEMVDLKANSVQLNEEEVDLGY
jgi:chromate transport protein ChrA